jgi:hypothetical protein
MAKKWEEALTWGQRAGTAWSIFQSAFFKFYIWPVLSAMMTGAAGYLGGVPLMWVLVAVAIVFACVAQSWLRISEIMERINPRNKLAYIQTVVHMDLKGGPQPTNQGGSTGRARRIEKMQIGVELQNRSSFPMSLIVSNAETEVAGIFPPRTPYPKPAITVLPGGLIRCLDVPILMKDTLCGRLSAKMSIKIKYGMQGDEDDELNFDAVLDIVFQPNGTLTQLMTFWNPNTPMQGQIAPVSA